MNEDSCPYCGNVGRLIRYNKWHVREVYCNNCYRCLNQDYVRKQTRLAEMASSEGKIDEFYMGMYKPSELPDLPDNEVESKNEEEVIDKIED